MDRQVVNNQPNDKLAEARLESVLDTAVDGIIVIDSAGSILMFNKACEKLFGYSAADILGKNVKNLMPTRFSDDHDSYLSSYLKTGNAKIIGMGREVAGMHRDGTVFPIELSVGESDTSDGMQFIGIIRDLRSRKNIESRLANLQSELLLLTRIGAMDEMGAAVAHELNQPLTALLLYLQAANRKIQAIGKPEIIGEKTLEVLEKAMREAQRAGNIVRRMRQFVERREPQRKSVHVAQLIEEAIEVATLGRRPNELEVRRADHTDNMLVRVDPVQIQQVLINLLRNAWQAISNQETKWIEITSKIADGNLIIEVRDSGPGIPHEYRDNLFKAFSSTKRHGVGLGLSISKTILQNHGGELTFHPGGGGQGATFILQLPVTI